MNLHHQAVRRQAIRTAMNSWNADLTEALAQGSENGLNNPLEHAFEAMFDFDSGFDSVFTISSGKAVSAVV